jgi:DNA-binding CsgD family transcriptional regulator
MTNNKNKIHSKAINKILASLQESLGINYFTYCKYTNEHCEIISSDPIAATHFFNDNDSSSPIKSQESETILAWSDYCSNNYMDFITQRYGDNGVTFVLRHDHHSAEHISLHSTFQDLSLLHLTRENPSITNTLVSHVRNHINFNIESFERLCFEKIAPKSTENVSTNAKPMIKLHNREYIYGLNGPTYITRAEKRIFLLMLQMKTSKEIAEDLGKKVRTIECHVANMRKKLGIEKRHDFFTIAKNNFIIS